LAGPKRPQDRIDLPQVGASFRHAFAEQLNKHAAPAGGEGGGGTAVAEATRTKLTDGSVVIAAITSCTNTSNPSVMLAPGLLRKEAVERGLRVPGYVKTSLTPGSRVVTDYFEKAGLTPYLEQLGFHTAGYGCATCIGNSGPLSDVIAREIESRDLVAAAV